MKKKIIAGLCILSMSNITVPVATLQERFFDEIRKGNKESVETLLEKTPKLINATNNAGSSPLQFAIFFGHGNIVELLLEWGARINTPNTLQDDNTPLHDAVNMKDADIVQLLLYHKANINRPNKHGDTPLKRARGNEAITKLLLEAGAHPEKEDEKEHKSTKSLGSKKEKALPGEQQDQHDEGSLHTSQDSLTPLHRAALIDKASILALLMAKGKKPSSK